MGRWNRIFGFLSFIAAAAYHYVFEFIRTIFYDRILHVLNPYINTVALDHLFHWGPTPRGLFGSIGLMADHSLFVSS